MSDDYRQEGIFSLPLFPLHTVLFPGFPLELHVFEERYRVMINQCIENRKPFGVVLIRSGAEVGEPAVPYEIGCTARIGALKKFQDGRMQLLVTGERRFRILEYSEADLPYLVSRAELVDDEPDASAETTEALAAEVQTVFLAYLNGLAERAGMSPLQIELPDSPALLSFAVGAVALLEQEDRQSLLSSTSVPWRLRRALDLIGTQSAALMPDEPEAPVNASPVDLTSHEWQDLLNRARN